MKANWENAVYQVTHLPKSQLPGLLVKLAERAIEEKVFRAGGASRIVQAVEEATPPNQENTTDARKVCSVCGGVNYNHRPGCKNGY